MGTRQQAAAQTGSMQQLRPGPHHSSWRGERSLYQHLQQGAGLADRNRTPTPQQQQQQHQQQHQHQQGWETQQRQGPVIVLQFPVIVL